MRRIKICPQCTKSFEEPNYQKKVRFCSMKCATQSKIGTHRTPEKLCHGCGTYFRDRHCINKRKYCSRKCFFNSVKGTKRQKPVTCKYCAKKFYDVFSSGKIFCDSKCMGMARRKKTNMSFPPGFHNNQGYERSSKRIYSHRNAVEKHIGRKLNEDEVVHHINFNRIDNRIDNLKVMTKSEHSKLHRAIQLQTQAIKKSP